MANFDGSFSFSLRAQFEGNPPVPEAWSDPLSSELQPPVNPFLTGAEPQALLNRVGVIEQAHMQMSVDQAALPLASSLTAGQETSSQAIFQRLLDQMHQDGFGRHMPGQAAIVFANPTQSVAPQTVTAEKQSVDHFDGAPLPSNTRTKSKDALDRAAALVVDAEPSAPTTFKNLLDRLHDDSFGHCALMSSQPKADSTGEHALDPHHKPGNSLNKKSREHPSGSD
ncbi:MAG: hypothetical protein JSS62_01730 [Verrucomicrobia bacterium]|nr:hypothetical protein [Verrucomicrobiota bacterium]MBS0645655.1 hypothetical protein [Verrucomicrobiota bacterium]